MVSSSVPAPVAVVPFCVRVVPRVVIACPSDPHCLSDNGGSADLCRFRRSARLLTSAEYAAVFATRRVLHGGQFALHYRSNAMSAARLGLVIPKKQARSAVLRNAIKRQARECFRQRQADLPAFDLILRLARPSAARAGDPVTRAAWRDEITNLFTRLAAKA